MLVRKGGPGKKLGAAENQQTGDERKLQSLRGWQVLAPRLIGIRIYLIRGEKS